MQKELNEVKQDVSVLKEDVNELKEELGEVKTDLCEVKGKVIKLELVLENEVRVNIKRVAEGHLDLYRNLHEAMKPNTEVEMSTIRGGMLESDMREIKSKIS